MQYEELLNLLFKKEHTVDVIDGCLTGHGNIDNINIAVIGTINAKFIGVETACFLAGEILKVVKEHDNRPILLLIDTSGQRLNHKDELLGINSYLAHLAKCIDLARREGHLIVSLIYGQCVSGGYLSTASLADACYAITDAELKVMSLDAMSRVTKIPQKTLKKLSTESPVFAPGVENYYKMGALNEIWSVDGDIRGRLASVLNAKVINTDERKALGESRGGRLLANTVSTQVRESNV